MLPDGTIITDGSGLFRFEVLYFPRFISTEGCNDTIFDDIVQGSLPFLLHWLGTASDEAIDQMFDQPR